MSLSGIMAGAAYIKLTMNDAQAVQALDRTKSSLKSFAAAASSAGDTLSLVAAPLSAMIDRYIKFSDTMLQVKAVSDASGLQLKRLREQASELGRTTAFTSTQVAQGMVELARMGFTADEVSKAIRPAMNLVRSTGEEMWRLGEFSEYTANILRIFNLRANEFGRVADVMAMAANKSSVDIADLGMSLKIVGPSAKAMGESLESTTALLMTLADTGIRGSEAGTMLRRVFQAIAEQSAEGKEAAKHLRDLGIQLKTSTGKARSARDIFVDLSKKMQAMSDIERVNFSVDVFDLRGSAAALNLAEFSSKLKIFETDLSSSAGYASEKAKQMETEFGGAIREMKSALEELGIAWSEVWAKNLTPFVDGITGAAKAVGDFIKENSVAVGVFTKFALSVGAIGGALKATFAVASGVSKIFDPVRKLDAMIHSSKESSVAARAIKESKAVVAAEEQKLAAQKRTEAIKQAIATRSELREKQKAVAEAQAVILAEKQKLAAIQERYAAEEAKNKRNFAHQLFGGANTTGVTEAAKNVAEQQKVVDKAIANTRKLAEQENVLAQQMQKKLAVAHKSNIAYHASVKVVKKLNNVELHRSALLARLMTMDKAGNISKTNALRLARLLWATKLKDIIATKQQAGANAFAATMAGVLAKANAAVALSLEAIRKAFAKNPIGMIISAISVAASAISYVIGKIDEARNKALALAQENIDKATEKSEEGKRKRSAARENMRGLTQLAEISKEVSLTADEMREAEQLIKDMDWAGASQWAQLDKTAQKLTIIKDKMEEMTDVESLKNALAMQGNLVRELKNQIDELGYQNTFGTDYSQIAGYDEVGNAIYAKKITGRTKRTNLNDEEKQKLADLERQLTFAEKEYKKYLALDMDAIMGLEKTQGERNNEREQKRLATAEELKKAKEEMLKLDKEAADSEKESIVREKEAIENKVAEYLDFYKKVIAAEKDIQKIKVYQNNLDKVTLWRDKQIAELEKKRAEAWKDVDRQTANRAKNIKEEKAKFQWERKLNKLQESGNKSGALQMVKEEYLRLKSAVERAETEKADMRKNFALGSSEDGSSLGANEKKALNDKENEINKLSSEMMEYYKKFYNIKDQMDQQKPQTSTIGSWSAANLSRALGGGGNPAERTARATEETVKLLKKTNSKLENNTMEYK